MRGKVLFLAGLIIAAGVSGFAQARTLRLAVFQLEPFMLKDEITGAVGGAVVDYWVKYLGPRMGYDIEVVGLFPVTRVEKMLESGEIDLAPLFTKVPSRESRFLYPKTHYFEVTSCLMVLPDSPIKKIEKQEDLFDKRVGFLEGAFIPPIMLHQRITIELVANEDYRQINLNKLFAGRIDVWLDINQTSLLYYLKQRGYAGRVRLVSLPTDKTPIYSIFRDTAEGKLLAAEYDRLNAEGQKKGVFDSYLQAYLK